MENCEGSALGREGRRVAKIRGGCRCCSGGGSTPAAAATEREYVEKRMAIEQRAGAEEQQIGRRLRSA